MRPVWRWQDGRKRENEGKRTDSDGERPLTNAECRAIHSQEDAKEEEGASTIGRAFRPFWLSAIWEASAGGTPKDILRHK